MELSEFIKKWRTSHGLSMQEFADKAGLSKGFISQIENDFRNNKSNKRMSPSLESMRKLAKACDMSISEFFDAVDTEISLVKEPESVSSRPAYPEFKTAQEAIKYILEFPMVAQFGGYNLDEMTDQELIDMANLVAQLIRGVAVSNESKGGSTTKTE